jgi:hypothetical protein
MPACQLNLDVVVGRCGDRGHLHRLDDLQRQKARTLQQIARWRRVWRIALVAPSLEDQIGIHGVIQRH